MRLTNVAQMSLPRGTLHSFALRASSRPGARLPISFDQRRHVGEGARAGSWMAVAFRVPAAAGLDDIAAAWVAMIGRHGTLRSAFSHDPDGDLALHEIEIEDGESVYDEGEGSQSDDEEELPVEQLTYGDSPYELVLPSGARIGHRSMARYYKQSFSSPLPGPPSDQNSGAGLVRRLLADKNSALVPSKGGYGAFGTGTVAIKARNRGEAKEAGRHVREFRDQKRREDFKTKVGFIANSQKHYRDRLLQ